MIILIDHREKLPYSFSNYPVEVEKVYLPTGDYSLKDHEQNIVIERKSKEDLFMSLGQNRDRFEKECQRLSEFPYPFLIIESSLSGLLIPPDRSQMNPKSVIQSLISWGIRHRLSIYFADTRTLAECLIYSIFQKYLYNLGKKKIA